MLSASFLLFHFLLLVLLPPGTCARTSKMRVLIARPEEVKENVTILFKRMKTF